MYNRYIPAETSYTAVAAEIPVADTPKKKGGETHRTSQPPPLQALFSQKDSLFHMWEQERSGVGKILKTLKLDRFDSGDLLVLMILLLLLSEGDDWDPVIALGMFLFLEIMEK